MNGPPRGSSLALPSARSRCPGWRVASPRTIARRDACQHDREERSMPNQPAPRPTPNWAADFPKLREATDNWLFGDIWERSGLSKRDRSLITVAMLTALYRHEQLPGHVGRALDTGVTKDALVEVITHATFYSGWPTGVQGAVIAKKVFESGGL